MAEANVTVLNYDRYRQPAMFAALMIATVPSLACTLFIMGFFFSHWHLMITKALYHHTVFLLIIISFLYTVSDLPLSLNYYRLGYHSYRSIPLCVWWYWYDYSLTMISRYLVATASIQRHVLIFHSQWLQVRRKRWMLHYAPLILCIFCPLLFYTILMYLYQCTVYFDYNEPWCAYPCYLDDVVLYNIDWFISIILPVFAIVVANLALFIRVIRSMKRIRRQQGATWKRQKRLTLQLFAFSSLYLLTWLPMTVVALLHALVLPNLYSDLRGIYYVYNMAYFVCPLQPFLCIFALPELTDFIKRRTKRMMTRAVVVPTMTRRTTG